MLRILFPLLCMLAPFASLLAQGNRSLAVADYSNIRLPGAIEGIYYCDNALRLRANGMLFCVRVSGNEVLGLDIDTSMVAIDPQMSFAVRNRLTGSLFYTHTDSKGVSRLFEYYEKRPGVFSSRRIQPQRFSFSIEHPVFALGDSLMIFASDCPLGMGNRDLWYSVLRNGEWSYPQNLGFRINSEGDDFSPAMYGDFLVFSSNGHPASRGGSDLYASRLATPAVLDGDLSAPDDENALPPLGDIGNLFLGRSDVYSMAEPLCSFRDDFNLSFAPDGSHGWWCSMDPDSTVRLMAFHGRLDGVQVVCNITDMAANPLVDATISVARDGVVEYSVHPDKTGNCLLFLQPEMDYELSFSAPNHFSSSRSVKGVRLQEGNLYAVEYLPVSLNALAIDSTYLFDDLFDASASSDLSLLGRKRMEAVARFLVDNPHLHLRIVSAFNASPDAAFCTLLNQARNKSLQDFLQAQGVPLSALHPSLPEPATVDDAPRQSVYLIFTY